MQHNSITGRERDRKGERESERERESYIELESHFISDLLIFCSDTSVEESPTCQLCQTEKNRPLNTLQNCFSKPRLTRLLKELIMKVEGDSTFRAGYKQFV